MTIREVAQFFIEEGKEEDFIAAYTGAVVQITSSEGCHGAVLRRGIETPTWFVLMVEWDSVEAHQAFRDSERLAKWRAPITPFFAKPPTVEHVEDVA
ncbi:Antibiotic biosynthesis monooxygenase [Corynebacterium ciconiae DSM 44920]|uniref:antibiotic biosynthesis monooxygenase family protein n=1 Tax=Corynebacterium ciconiae TaxID=227319 RepID=UPI00037AFF5C|nr:antibiotic biosynthesis monooxygenase family protein [Corynebacterium ciconiae]WKD61107.1 Antibiotic biosynthesis monooxygenase [Corynebacterium ciconiae DSM 44920]